MKQHVLLVHRGISSPTHAVSGKSLKSYGFATQSSAHGGVVFRMTLEEYAAAAHDIIGNTQPQQQWVPEIVTETNVPKDRGKCCIPAGCPNEADYRSGVDLYCSGHAPNDAERLYEDAPPIGTFPMGLAPAPAADVLATLQERPGIIETGAGDAPIEQISPNIGSQTETDSAAKPKAIAIEKPEPIIYNPSTPKESLPAAPASHEAEGSPHQPTPPLAADKQANALDAVTSAVVERIQPQLTALTEMIQALSLRTPPAFFSPPPRNQKRQVKPAAGGEQAALRAEAKALGINVFQKSNDQLRALIAEQKAGDTTKVT